MAVNVIKPNPLAFKCDLRFIYVFYENAMEMLASSLKPGLFILMAFGPPCIKLQFSCHTLSLVDN